MVNRDEKIGNCRRILLEPNKKQKINKKHHILIDNEDYHTIKKYNWKVERRGGKLNAVAYIGGKYQIITKVLWPEIGRIHRINGDQLDIRKDNIKHFVNEKNKVSKPITVQKSLEKPKEDETKMFVVSVSNYNAIKTICEEEGLKDNDSVVSVLLESHERYKELLKPKTATVEIRNPNRGCNNTLWDKLKAKLGIV